MSGGGNLKISSTRPKRGHKQRLEYHSIMQGLIFEGVDSELYLERRDTAFKGVT